MPTRNSIKCIDLLLGKLRQMTMMKILKNVKKSSQKIPDIFIDKENIPVMRRLQKALMTFFLALETSWLTKYLQLSANRRKLCFCQYYRGHSYGYS